VGRAYGQLTSGAHIPNAIARAGLNPQALKRAVEMEPERYDALVEENQKVQKEAGHTGVPLFVFQGEPLFGQDRLQLLVWRMRHCGLAGAVDEGD
jgi:2-hydroxychromene-2-carboxylate isomerase